MSETALSFLPRCIARADGFLARFPASLTQLALRIALAVPFFRSGLTKWDGFLQLSDSAVYLFAEEFRLHLFGLEVAYPAPQLMAFLSGAGEIILPILLVLGLGTRFAALGLLVMTAIIQLTIPDGWANFHLPWAAMALGVMTYGPGRVSLDHLVAAGAAGSPRHAANL
ncbi:DoxX family protein [Xanthobacter autotrophicus]|uniref:DoxX family protein n=1 Tax=Xanthobacter TaxID=279 RepID=UPI0024AB8E79|nr:DoxX family protein [Xanthobacter autotrophicus]MDI4665923.1 DoxX family protein [Xanthobacter autotrophicus]